jgi:PAS domain-containing protein
MTDQFSIPMDTIVAAQPLLDDQKNLAIWYAAYEGSEESVLYANPLFCKTFELPLDEILERKRYQLVNPPDTPAETIEQYKAEDREAIERGHFLQRSPIEPGKDILVLKLGFDQGIVGMFKIIDSDSPPTIGPRDLDADFRNVIESLRTDLIA